MRKRKPMKHKNEITFDTPIFDEDGITIVCQNCLKEYAKENGHFPKDFYPEISKEEFDGQTCDCGKCDGIMFQHQRCHTKKGLEVFYFDGYLYAQCWICLAPVWKTRVAE